MKFRERIIHKGLILISVPLLLGILLVFQLTNLLSQAGQEIKHELCLKEAMATADKLARAQMVARASAIAFKASRDSMFKNAYDKKVQQIADSYKQLLQLLKDEPALGNSVAAIAKDITRREAQDRFLLDCQMPSDPTEQKANFQKDIELLSNKAHNKDSLAAAGLFESLQSLASQETGAALQTMCWIQLTLFWGVVTSVFISLIFAAYFSRNISCRLLNILWNTSRLSENQALNPPMPGSDEIADLDKLLYKSAKEIREHERFQHALVGVVSHELKTPLTSVSGILSALSNGLFGDLEEKTSDRVRRAEKNLVRLMELIKDLLRPDKREGGNLEISLVPVDMDDVLAISLDSVRDLSEQAGVNVEIDNSCDTMVLADRDHLVHAVVNLITHAIKSSAGPGTMKVKTFLTDGWLEGRVINENPVAATPLAAPGVSPELSSSLASNVAPDSINAVVLSSQSNNKESGGREVTSLELAICRSIVEQHGGNIGIETNQQRGNTFWFKIPGSPVTGTDGVACRTDGNFVSKSSPVGLPREKKKSGMQLKIWHKGIILIAVPLVFELGFVAVLGGLLYETKNVVQSEERSQDVIVTVNQVMNKLVEADSEVAFYMITRKSDHMRAWEQITKDATRLYNHLKEQTAGDVTQKGNVEQCGQLLFSLFSASQRALNIEETSVSKMWNRVCTSRNSKKYVGEGQVPTDTLLTLEAQHGEKQSQRREDMSRQIGTTLAYGIYLNLLISFILALYFMRSITSRLRHVMDNTGRLVRREPLAPPMKGSDEIAYLDLLFCQTAQQLRELEAKKHELITVISDELRMPLASVQTTLKLLLSGALGELSAKAQSRLKVAEKEIDRLVRLINELLNIKKMEAGKFALELTEVPVADLLQSSVAAVAQVADNNNIRIEIEAVAAGKLTVDRDRLTQVIINLLSNAIKFSPGGSCIRLVAKCNASRLEILVIDQGRGIPARLQERIFDRFFQVQEEDATKKGGSGLGLAIVKSIMEQHGGTIRVDSEEGCGSTFWLSLPVKAGAKPAGSPQKKDPPDCHGLPDCARPAMA